MARGKTSKLYRTFVKGLITEAGFLTYPENASTDELNTVIKNKGSRSRRFGIDYEPDSVASTITGASETSVVSEFHWRSVGNDSSVNFLCVQIGSTIHFYDTSSEPVTSGKKSFTLDLLPYKSTGSTDADIVGARCQMDNGKGFLFIAHPYTEPLVVEYDADTDTISTIKIIIQIRDFDGVDDGLLNDQEPTTLSKEHYYNLRNQGWVIPGSTGVFTGATPPADYTADDPPPSTGGGGWGWGGGGQIP